MVASEEAYGAGHEATFDHPANVAALAKTAKKLAQLPEEVDGARETDGFPQSGKPSHKYEPHTED